MLLINYTNIVIHEGSINYEIALKRIHQRIGCQWNIDRGDATD